jgi:hypothetical protein
MQKDGWENTFEILLLNDANMIGEHLNTFIFGRTLGNKNENARKDTFGPGLI